MSVEEITTVRNRCVCELPDCIGKGRPWYSKGKTIPQRCRWCHSRTWNGRQDKRYTQNSVSWVRVRKCDVCGGTEFAEGHDGLPVCVHCSGASLTAGPKKQTSTATATEAAAVPARPKHAAGCTCLTCKLEQEEHHKPKRPKRAAIELPKPKKVRSIE